MSSDQKPKIQIDSDWKAEARAEKERLARAEEKTEGQRRRAGELPKADFRGLISVIASQAIMGLGALGDSKTGRIVVDLPGARFGIDLLSVLEDKTKGNLTEEESRELGQVLAELRARFVQIAEMIAQQSASQQKARPAAEA